ncbi:hypothetical protein SLEP1_g21101 [Rubroshorea leprosula]|uniref:Uncharacterized protein n=1 Tax=Rubroshorea leprosula TaxID=152421 RepID=A0AAV5JFI0_9ROSI|nr:hypothetical protein SLEP1_g21101 [Rubroshorea leprosula]
MVLPLWRSCSKLALWTDITHDDVAVNSWTLCTTEQVEELKALIKVLPLWSMGAAN